MANDITIKLRVDDQGSVVIDKFTSQGSRKLRDFTGDATSSIGAMTSTMTSYWVEITAAIAAFKGAWDMINLAAKLQKQEEAFRNLAASYKTNADAILANLDRVAKGTVDDSDLIRVSGQAMMRGLDPAGLVKIMEIARATTRITGESTLQAYEGISEAVSRVQVRQLKYYGIILDQKDVMRAYADSINKTTEQLTAHDRQQAILNETVKQGAGLLARMGEQTDSYSTKLAQFSAQMQNLKEMVAGGLLRAFQMVVAGAAAVASAFYGTIATFLAGLADLSGAVDRVLSKIPGYSGGQSDITTYLQATRDAMVGITEGGFDFAKLNFDLATSFEKTATAVQPLPPMIDELGESEGKTKTKTMDLAAEMAKLQDIMEKARDVNATAGWDDWAVKYYALNKKWGELIDKMVYQSRYIGASEEQIKAQTDEMAKAYTEEYGDLVTKQNEEQLKDSKDMYKKQEDASRETYESMAGFFRDALTQMGNDAGSFTDMLISKMKNLAASLAGNALASIAMSIMGISNPAASKDGGIMSLFGFGGGGSSGGMNFGSMFSNGGSLYKAYGYLSSLFGGGGAGGSTPLLFTNGQITGAAGTGEAAWGTGTPAGGGANIGGMAGSAGYAAAIVFAINTILGYGKADKAGFGDMKAGYGVYSGAKTFPGVWEGASAIQGSLGQTGLMALTAGDPILGPWASLGMFTDTAAINKRLEQIKLAEGYSRGVNRAANADISDMSLSQYVKGGSSILGDGATEAAIEIGGLKGKDIDNQLLNLVEVAKDYKKAIETAGGASAQALGQFARGQATMSGFAIASAKWTDEARGLAQQWLQIGKNAKELQIKEITTNLTQGIGLFSANIDKLKIVGMDTKAFNDLIATEGLKFLATDTLPALTGELSKVREEYKKAAEAVGDLATQQEAVSVKEKILLSDMKLTESQLRALKYGDVNTDLINLYTALGWTDEAFTVISASTVDLCSGWEALSEAGKTLQTTMDGIAAQYKNVDIDKIPEILVKTYGAMSQVAAGLDMIGMAGDKLADLPEVFEAMGTAISDMDLAGFNTQLLSIADTFMYLSGVAATVGAPEAAVVLGGMGTAISAAYTFIELVLSAQLIIQSAVQSLVTHNAVVYNTLDAFLSKMDELGGGFSKLADKWREAWLSAAGDVITTLNELQPMTYDEAVAGVGKWREYKEHAGESDTQKQIHTVQDESDAEIKALNLQHEIDAKKYAKWGTTAAETKLLKAQEEAIRLVKEQTAAYIAELLQVEKEQLTKPWKNIIATKDMGDFDKQLYNLTQSYQDQRDALVDLGLSTEEFNANLDLLNESFSIEALDAINDHFKTIFDSITDFITSINTSSLNVFANPEQMATNFAENFNKSVNEFNSADASGIGAAWSGLSSDATAYLNYMHELYGSSAKYQEAYWRVMSVLGEAQERVEAMWNGYKSKYEADSIALLTAISHAATGGHIFVPAGGATGVGGQVFENPEPPNPVAYPDHRSNSAGAYTENVELKALVADIQAANVLTKKILAQLIAMPRKNAEAMTVYGPQSGKR